MERALSGVRILDFTHVQSGPSCTQILAWLGADVIKIEKPGEGDITRGQLRDVPGADSLYFTMLNHNKRSLALDTKSAAGKGILERLIAVSDVLVENFAPGALDRMGFAWERIHALNPKLVLASIKGFGPGPYEQAKVYENVAQCIGGSASTTGFDDGPPLVTGSQVGDAGTGLNLAIGICAALLQRTRTGRGQQVSCAMQDGVLNLCRIKLRDQQRMERAPLRDYPQFLAGKPFGEALPRIGNASGGGQPGAMLRCKGWASDPNAYVYFIAQGVAWPKICEVIGEPGWKTDPGFATHDARLARLDEVFLRIERWTRGLTKHEATAVCTAAGIPCGPVMSMKDLASDPALRATGAIVEVDHPVRGPYLSVGNPVRLSDSPHEVTRSPLLGEHTAEILREVLGLSPDEIAAAASSTSARRDDPLPAD